jgi:hypothetical protein
MTAVGEVTAGGVAAYGAAQPAAAAADAERAGAERDVWTRRLHRLLAAQSLILVLASVNRLWSGTDAQVLPQGSLRVVDVVNLFVLVPASALAFYLLLEHLLPDLSPRGRRALRVAFVAALYLFAVSYGMHEPADYLNARFCAHGEGGALCDIVDYQDDQLAHFLYFAGLLGIDVVLLVAQAKAATLGTDLSTRDRALVLVNASLVALVIVANLAFEAIGIDLIVVAAVAALALYLLRRCGPRALLLYFAWAYGAGLAVTLAAKAI